MWDDFLKNRYNRKKFAPDFFLYNTVRNKTRNKADFDHKLDHFLDQNNHFHIIFEK